MEVASRKKQLEQRYRESVEEVRRCEERLQRCASDAASGVDAVRACEELINSARSELNSVAFDAAAFDRLETRVRDVEQECARLRRAVEEAEGELSSNLQFRYAHALANHSAGVTRGS